MRWSENRRESICRKASLYVITSVGVNNQSFVFSLERTHPAFKPREPFVHQLHLFAVMACRNDLSFSVPTAQEEGDLLPSLLCLNGSDRLATVWIQHRSHQCTWAGVCGCAHLFLSTISYYLSQLGHFDLSAHFSNAEVNSAPMWIVLEFLFALKRKCSSFFSTEITSFFPECIQWALWRAFYPRSHHHGVELCCGHLQCGWHDWVVFCWNHG